jgi:hypothetical protein
VEPKFPSSVESDTDRETKMSQVDPWEKAAECARAIQISHDPHRKAVLNNLQQMWVALATERSFLSPERLAREVEAIGRLHLTLTEGDGRTHH